MRNGTIANNSGQVLARVEYPARYAFAFNPLLITVVEETGDVMRSAWIQIGDFLDERSPINGEITFDVGPYSCALFDIGNISDNRERIQPVSISVGVIDADGNSYSSDIQIDIIWGAIAPTEEYNGLTSCRWFSRFPMKLEFFAQDGAKVYKEIDGKGTHTLVSTVSDMGIASIDLSGAFEGDTVVKKAALSVGDFVNVFDETFDFTFANYESEWEITLKKDDSPCGVFLRWIDKHGFMRYFLFSEGEESTESEDYGDLLEQKYSAFGRYYPNIYRQQGKSVTRKMNIAALHLTREEYEYVRSVAFSPVVDMYMGDDEGTASWLPVLVSSGDTGREQKILEDMEVELYYNEATQKY
ncbi:MAG TPA: hypothetical protein DHU85_03915 [Porphyromonadaceae bacterium]|jgi:hypothetical protein|nr:hypothetical protein [Porphyromonadaceae bacterium]